jgi:hypothetical protein
MWWFRSYSRLEAKVAELEKKVMELDKRVLFLLTINSGRPVPPKKEETKEDNKG